MMQLPLPSGSYRLLKVYGTLDYPKKEEKRSVMRCTFSSYLFAFDQGTIILDT